MNRFLLLACLLSSVCVGVPARAGFEWVPPVQATPDPVVSAAAPPAPPAVEAMPMPDMVPMPPEPEPMMAMKKDAPRDLMPEKAKMDPDMVQGFGRDIPLTIATRQMVPSTYSVQYGQDVDPNISVTWTGGRAWKTALNDALAERDLKSTIVADSVMIERVAPLQQSKAEPLPAPVTAPVMEEVMVEPAVMPAPEPVIAVTAPPVPTTSMWVAPKASTLRQVLTDWSKTAGVQMQWSAQYDYPLMSDVQVSGTFEEAVETILGGLVDAQPRPVARLHPNAPNGPAILVVETRNILE